MSTFTSAPQNTNNILKLEQKGSNFFPASFTRTFHQPVLELCSGYGRREEGGGRGAARSCVRASRYLGQEREINGASSGVTSEASRIRVQGTWHTWQLMCVCLLTAAVSRWHHTSAWGFSLIAISVATEPGGRWTDDEQKWTMAGKWEEQTRVEYIDLNLCPASFSLPPLMYVCTSYIYRQHHVPSTLWQETLPLLPPSSPSQLVSSSTRYS